MLFTIDPEYLQIKLNQTAVHRFLGPKTFYPNKLPYYYGNHFYWRIQLTQGLRIKVVLRLFEYGLAQGDSIQFRDGKDKSAPLLRTFTSSFGHNQTFPALLSSGSRLFYQLMPDKQFTASGFEVTRTGVLPQGNCFTSQFNDDYVQSLY